MTLEEKIAQMIVIYYISDEYDNLLSNVIQNVNPGGFILLKENITNNNQLLEFIRKMQEDSKIPMFITIDQEGGTVQRLHKKNDIKVETIPDMKTIGDTKDYNKAYEIGKQIGKDLYKYGINMNFAPVIDIYSNSDNTLMETRSFGNNPDIVSNMGIEVARGLIEEQIIPVYKHFPGHEDTSVDSHYDLPILNKTYDELLDFELIPFIKAIENDAKAIMVGHIATPKITNDNTPASLSKIMITDILRERLGFDGIVITDALNMVSLTKNYTQKEIIIKAINAGANMLLMPGSSKQTISIIKEAIEQKEIEEKLITNSAKKILELKFSNNAYFEDYYKKTNS
ncbi:MAG: glycoside hydrolase family 3 protein [Mollicutes bacterium]|nr:glycoside hydrolase family 3 protein [Mollicutes bacterium]